MSTKYTTKIDLNKRKSNLKNHSRFTKKNSRNYSFGGFKSINPLARFDKAKKEKLKKAAAVVFGVLFVAGFFGFIFGMSYLQSITAQLPSPDAPFGKRNEASVIYASNTNDDGENEQLYKVFGEENRDYIKIDEVPEYVKWAIVSAEDVDFYDHPGIDIGGIIKALAYELFKIGTPRGGSTITQQLIKQTSLTSDRSYERKIQEIILALQVERLYSKDQILEMYINVNNFGSNVYGLKTAAKFYFNKEVKDLNLAEAAVLARIPQNPVYNSPTLAPDPEDGKERAERGREYVLEQMEKNLNKINDHIESDDNIIVMDEIEEAKTYELKYEKPRINIKAPHFVFYIQKLLTQRNYNNGVPFELSQIQTGGYKIYTTLDMNVQRIAEEEVLNGVNKYAKPYGGNNGAAIITRPASGDIVAMVGSKSYDAESEGKLFDGKVNVTDTLQSMGSTMKPVGYYKAFELGISSPGSYLPDVEIQLGNYKPKNYNNAFNGPIEGATARRQLVLSRNIPAIILLDAMGLKNYIDTLIKWGYTTVEANPTGFGPSTILGGGDVTMIEHAQAYGVFSNGGQLVKLDPIQKITKYNPESGEDEVVYEKEVKKEPVADQRAIYMVNHILNYKNGGPGQNIDGRDYAGKTGTTEFTKDLVYAGYTPDFVVIGWNGNNDNTSMSGRGFGENVAKPWVIDLSKRIAPYFPEKTPFARPGGLNSGNACNEVKESDGLACAESGGDLLIEGKLPPPYIFKKKFKVCSDQPDRLAREIDEKVGKAVEVEVNIYKMASPGLQPFLDTALSKSNAIPTEYCNIERSPNSGNPWAVFNTPSNGATVSGSLNVDLDAYSIAGYVTKVQLKLGSNTIEANCSADCNKTINISGYETGTYTLSAKIFDNTGLVGDSSITVFIDSSVNHVNVVAPGSATQGNPVLITNTTAGTGYTISSKKIFIIGPTGSVEVESDITASYSWTPQSTGTYKIYVKAFTNAGVTLQSVTKNVTVN